MLLNINTNRLFWHAGAGIDEYEKTDRYKLQMDELGSVAYDIHDKTKTYINQLWDSHLENK